VVPKDLTGLVVDTNILFSILQKDGITRKLFFLLEIELYAPNFLMIELAKNKDKILSASQMTENEFISIEQKIFSKINFVSEKLISPENRKKAFEMCKDIDETDTPFVALSLELKIPLWSGDKKLANGLRSKKFHGILTNQDLLR